MIRRETLSADGRLVWQLLCQTDHAHLAADLAAHWLDGSQMPPDVHRELLLAIRHHDDGWVKWDRDLMLEPQSGKPLAFDEIDAKTSNRIWEQSIDAVQRFGPFVSYVVARHFVRMRAASETSGDQANAFVVRNQRRCDHWLTLCAERPALAFDHAEAAVDQLQFFDKLSLLICLTTADATTELDYPGGNLTLEISQGNAVRLRPNPLQIERLQLTVRINQVPVARYFDAQQLQQAAKPGEIHWIVGDA